jgi:hypothetical protein
MKMSETGIEQEREYRILERVQAGVGLLWWVLIYGIAMVVVLLDMFVWRPW